MSSSEPPPAEELSVEAQIGAWAQKHGLSWFPKRRIVIVGKWARRPKSPSPLPPPHFKGPLKLIGRFQGSQAKKTSSILDTAKRPLKIILRYNRPVGGIASSGQSNSQSDNSSDQPDVKPDVKPDIEALNAAIAAGPQRFPTPDVEIKQEPPSSPIVVAVDADINREWPFHIEIMQEPPSSPIVVAVDVDIDREWPFHIEIKQEPPSSPIRDMPNRFDNVELERPAPIVGGYRYVPYVPVAIPRVRRYQPGAFEAIRPAFGNQGPHHGSRGF